MRYYMSLLQMYLENLDNFDSNLITAWQNEIKPFIYQKVPIVKDGLFNINSDLYYLIQIIDSFKDKYEEKKKEIEKKELEKKELEKKELEKKELEKKELEKKELENALITNNDNIINSNKKTKKNREEEEEEVHRKSVNFIRKEKKRRGTDQNLLESENYQIFTKKMSVVVIDNKKLCEIKEDNQIINKDCISKIKMIVLEFVDENIIPQKRTNSMQSLRPHSHTINSKTTRDSSVKEDDTEVLNLNINQMILSNDVTKNTTKKKEINNNKNDEKNTLKIYGNILIKEEQTNIDQNTKLKTYLRSKSIILLREMNPIYKDEVEAEGYSIIKNKDNKISFIYPDILLKKIIFEDFIKKNILLIHHFCQQCFCFLNKEIFFRKIFHCYNFYKKNTSKEKLKNLIEFINILIIEMFQYYQKIDLNDIYVTHIKNYYNELITDLILSMGLDIYTNDNKDSNENNVNSDHQFIFDSIDYLNINRNSNVNSNYIINKTNLININLNIEIKDIRIFIFNEKEKDVKSKIKEKEKTKEKENKNKNKQLSIAKSLTFRPSSLKNIKGKLFKEDEKNIKIKNQNLKKIFFFGI